MLHFNTKFLQNKIQVFFLKNLSESLLIYDVMTYAFSIFKLII